MCQKGPALTDQGAARPVKEGAVAFADVTGAAAVIVRLERLSRSHRRVRYAASTAS